MQQSKGHTIHQLLLLSYADGRGHERGTNAGIFPIDHPELREDFIARYSIYDNPLRATTCLVPPKLIYKGNYGQPLLVSLDKRLSIHRRQLGEQVLRKVTKSPVYALRKILSAADESNNPFVELIDTLYRIRLSDYRIDPNLKNIFFDDKSLSFRVVDQFSPEQQDFFGRDIAEKALSSLSLHEYKRCKSVEDIGGALKKNFANILGGKAMLNVAGVPDCSRELQKMQTLIEEAVDTVKAAHLMQKPQPMVGVSVGNSRVHYAARYVPFLKVAHTHAVALDKPSAALVQRLRELEAVAEAPSR